MILRTLASSALLALIACSSDDGNASSSSGGTNTPAQACRDVADAVAKAAQRCGADYQASYDQFVRGAANGDCSNIVSVRDEPALRQTCIPSISAMSCTDLQEARLDASCAKQLQRPASFQPTLAAASGPAAVFVAP